MLINQVVYILDEFSGRGLFLRKAEFIRSYDPFKEWLERNSLKNNVTSRKYGYRSLTLRGELGDQYNFGSPRGDRKVTWAFALEKALLTSFLRRDGLEEVDNIVTEDSFYLVGGFFVNYICVVLGSGSMLSACIADF